MLFNCHTDKDTIDTISVDDMKEFVEEIKLIINNQDMVIEENILCIYLYYGMF